MADIEKDAKQFRILTGMMPPGRSEPPSIVGQNMYERREVRTRLWEVFGKMKAVIANRDKELTELRATIAKLKGGVRLIRDYHASNHRKPLPRGTTRFCDDLLANTETAAEAAKEK